MCNLGSAVYVLATPACTEAGWLHTSYRMSRGKSKRAAKLPCIGADDALAVCLRRLGAGRLSSLLAFYLVVGRTTNLRTRYQVFPSRLAGC